MWSAKKRIPTSQRGRTSIINPGKLWNALKKNPKTTPIAMNMLPPTISQCHAITRKMKRIIDGIMCMKNARSSSSPLYSPKTSSAKVLRSPMKIIIKILGAQ